MSAKRRLLIACALTTIFYHLPAYSSLEYKGSFGSIMQVMLTGIVASLTLIVVKYGK